MVRLVEGLREAADYASRRGVLLAFEPEPGMFIDTMPAFETLASQIASPNFRLTLDIGHLQCQGETPIDAVIRKFAPWLANVHLEDMRTGVHEHLMFGEGEIVFSARLAGVGRRRLHQRHLRRAKPPQSRGRGGGPASDGISAEGNLECRTKNAEGMTKSKGRNPYWNIAASDSLSAFAPFCVD